MNHTRASSRAAQTPAILKLAALAILFAPGLGLALGDDVATLGPRACMGEGAEEESLAGACAGMLDAWYHEASKPMGHWNDIITIFVDTLVEDVNNAVQTVQDELP
ncbi:MAG: hypothetical protein ACPGQL_09800 [Thermoplasmatota archaeon]